MKPYIIIFKPRSLDDREELDIVYATSDSNAMFKWLNDPENNRKHYTGRFNDPITEEDVESFNRDYESFRKEQYKPSPYFGYN